MSALAEPREMGEGCSGRCWRRSVAGGVALFGACGRGRKVFPSPLRVEKGMVELLHKHVLWGDIGGFAAPRGDRIWRGRACWGFRWDWPWVGIRRLNQVVNPVMQILRPISPIAWIPVAIIFFGVGDQAAIFLIFLGAFFPDCGGVRERRVERAVGVSAGGAQFWTGAGATAGESGVSGGAAADHDRACGSRWELPGWWWWRRR